MRSIGHLFLFLAAVCGLAGCSGDSSGRPERVPVAAIVTFNGKPISGATVAFLADGGKHSASGITTTDGRAAMGTFGDGDGVVPGKYKITVRKVTLQTVGGDQTKKVESPDSDLPPGKTIQREELPMKYSQPDTSELTAEITKESPPEMKLELKN
jgi:hypothetical protein